MTRHFRCTACGKCCFGQLPLTWRDAEANAHLFPLAMIWTPVTQTSKDFKTATLLGAKIKLPDRKELAVLIVPTSFIPATQACPALVGDKLCSIHETKPARCKTMPFYPYRDERFQAEVLKIKDGWECDTSESAPLIFDDSRIKDRKDFDIERNQIIEEAQMMRRYAEYIQKYTPAIVAQLMLAASSPKPKHIVTSLSSFLTAIRYPNTKDLATRQTSALKEAISKTTARPELSEFHHYYEEWLKEMNHLAFAV